MLLNLDVWDTIHHSSNVNVDVADGLTKCGSPVYTKRVVLRDLREILNGKQR